MSIIYFRFRHQKQVSSCEVASLDWSSIQIQLEQRFNSKKKNQFAIEGKIEGADEWLQPLDQVSPHCLILLKKCPIFMNDSVELVQSLEPIVVCWNSKRKKLIRHVPYWQYAKLTGILRI